MTDFVTVTIDNAPIEVAFYDENTRESQIRALQADDSKVAAQIAQAAAEVAREQAADLVLPENIFIDVSLATAEAAVSTGTTFKLVDSADGVADVRRRTVGGSDLLYQENTKAGLEANTGAARIGTEDGTPLDTALLNRQTVISVDAEGAVGNAIPKGNKVVVAPDGEMLHDDSNAFEAAINKLWAAWARFITNMGTKNQSKIAVGGPRLVGTPGRCYYITRKLPTFPPGCHLDMGNCALVAGGDNIRIWWTSGGGVELPNIDPDENTDGLDVQYGNSNQKWYLPKIYCNGHAGTFVHFDTMQYGEIGPMDFYDAIGSSYTVNGALTANSSYVGLTPADFAKVEKGDVLNLGNVDAYGNPRPYLVADKKVMIAIAVDQTYGRLRLDDKWTGATGNVDVTQHSVPWVTQKMQQMTYAGRRQFFGCDWEAYHGRNADQVPVTWEDETVTQAYGFNDQDYGEHFSEGSKYGTVFGPWSADFTVPIMSQQFVREGTQLFINCIDGKFGDLRYELDPDASAPSKAKPCIVVGPGCKANIERQRVNTNGTGKYFLGTSADSEAIVDVWETLGGDIPVMPDGSRSPYVKKPTGTLELNGARGMNGPTIDGIPYRDNPRVWAGDGEGGPAPFGYTGRQRQYFRESTYSNGGEDTFRPRTGTAFSFVQHLTGDAVPNFGLQGNGALLFGTGTGGYAGEIRAVGSSMFYTAFAGPHVFQGDIFCGGSRVLTTRRASLPADATDLASAITLINAVKAGVKTTGGMGLFED